MTTLFAETGFKVKAALAAALAALTMSCGEELDVRTFDLSRLEASEAEALIAPYVFTDRERAPGSSSHTDGILTVRELPENLDRIGAVLDRYDQAAADVQLHFQIIEADGFAQRDQAIAEVEAELRKLLRYEGYRLVGEAVIQVREGGGSTQQRVQPAIEMKSAAGGVAPFDVEARVGRVRDAEDGTDVLLSVALSDPWNRLLETTVTVADGRTMVLGTTSGRPDREGNAAALILVVTPIIR